MKTKAFATRFLFISTLEASPSLFFTSQEVALIQSAHEKAKNSLCLSLSSIIYVDKDHWSIWLNNKLIQPQQPLEIKGLQLEQVTADELFFSWRFSPSSQPFQFSLRPNETILLKESKMKP